MSLKEHVAQRLTLFGLSEPYKNSRDPSEGGSVYMLAYCVEGEEPIEMGQIAKRSDGSYWWFTTCRKIHCGVFLGKHESYETAYEELRNYVASEISRVFDLTKPIHTHDLPVIYLRNSDLKACQRAGADIDDFSAGMDWALRTQGFPRRPAWAKFLVQNRDLSFTWFECMPTTDHNKGIWVCSEGRHLAVVLDKTFKEDKLAWAKSVRRVK